MGDSLRMWQGCLAVTISAWKSGKGSTRRTTPGWECLRATFTRHLVSQQRDGLSCRVGYQRQKRRGTRATWRSRCFPPATRSGLKRTAAGSGWGCQGVFSIPAGSQDARVCEILEHRALILGTSGLTVEIWITPTSRSTLVVLLIAPNVGTKNSSAGYTLSIDLQYIS